MIDPKRLARLPKGQRQRKAAKDLAAFEAEARRGELRNEPAMRSLLAWLSADDGLPLEIRARLAASSAETDPVRASCRAKADLLAFLGASPADWDFLDGPLEAGSRPRAPEPPPSKGPWIGAWLEDVRSPFNVGSMLRSAEAFSVDALYLTPMTADPLHPRAARSAKGCAYRVAWERRELADLPGGIPRIALELGGTPLSRFEFPERGMLLVGSEELGLSPQALASADCKLSIEMMGAKASLNAGVAFAIAMREWALAVKTFAPHHDGKR